MQAITLKATERRVVGKGVKKLRKSGELPVSVFGKDIKSKALTVNAIEFMKVYTKAGETGLVELKYDGGAHHTLISNVQIHPVTRQILHVEFHGVKLTEKIKAKVPVELIGDSPAVQNNIGLLLQTLKEVEVEALPTDLPEKIEVDVTKLTEIDQQVTVGELKVPAGVEVLTPGEEIVVKVAPAVSQETQKELAAEEAAKAAAVAESGAAPVEGGTPASTESPGETKEEKKEETKL